MHVKIQPRAQPTVLNKSQLPSTTACFSCFYVKYALSYFDREQRNRGQFSNLEAGKGNLGPLQHEFVPEHFLGFDVRILVSLIFRSYCEVFICRIRKTVQDTGYWRWRKEATHYCLKSLKEYVSNLSMSRGSLRQLHKTSEVPSPMSRNFSLLSSLHKYFLF